MTTVVEVSQSISRVEAETQALVDWAAAIANSDQTFFHKAQMLATRLGAHARPDGFTEIGFWAPELGADILQPKNIYLEILTPLESVDFRAAEQVISFRRDRLQLEKQGEYFWGVLSGMPSGTRAQLGALYWLRYLDLQNHLQTIWDPLAYSLPYGVFGPAEFYDMGPLQRQRADLDHFTQGRQPGEAVVQVLPPNNILQIHINTASQAGSLEGLTQTFRAIANKLRSGETLTPAEEIYLGYDAVQLLPIEPTVEYRVEHGAGQGFFVFDERSDDIDSQAETLSVTLKKPDTQNWGYDVVIAGSSAIDPSVLGTLRPDELVEFIETLHTFPTGPIQLIYDIVYGHADNQAQELLNGRFLKGPNMYGQDINHQNPTVRAVLLEMQRRKINTGADGVRIDGAQDFKFFNPISGRVEYDDTYLQEMSDVLQEIGGCQRRLFAIFEDGRPWPMEGWEEASTYRDVIDRQPDVFQWGPLIFAHNTPTLKGFWDSKWARVCEVVQQGENWVTGCANHDTLRRGTQIDPEAAINWNLGNTLPEVLDNAYNNPAIDLFTYGFCPGLPMDFLNAMMRAPWGFFRNTDDRYGVKVVSEEAGFLDWQVEPELYAHPEAFPRLKRLGFNKLAELRQFMRGLWEAIAETNYDLEEVAQLCQRYLGHEAQTETVQEETKQRRSASELNKLNGPEKSEVLTMLDVGQLKVFAKAFMEDCHELCTVSHYTQALDPARTRFSLNLRQYRHDHPWLRQNLTAQDRFNRISDGDRTLFYGLRSHPEADAAGPGDQIVMVAHMGGEPITVTLGDWLQLDLSEWQVAIASPGLAQNGNLDNLQCFELQDSQGLLLERVSEPR